MSTPPKGASLEKVEYRIIPHTRYSVTRFHSGWSGNTGGCETKGEFDNPDIAQDVAYALCREEHQRLGWPLADERIQYPRHPQRSKDETRPTFDPIGSGGMSSGPTVAGSLSGG